MPRYNPATIEPKWQQYWEANRTFATPRMPGDKKMYVLDMFPYPSGDGLHVGHPEGYTATDIVCRYKRMLGVTVMHPMGFDSFGLPAEEAAINRGVHPREFTEKNIDNFRRQLKMLGFSYDWSRELATTDPEYFRWTQFIFLVLFDTWFDEDWEEGSGFGVQGSGKEAGGGGQESDNQTPDTKRPDDQSPKRRGKGRPISELPIPDSIRAAGEEAVRRYQDSKRLAYQHEAPVNWCPALGTVLANEEVVGGLSERGNHPVVRIPLRQWMLRITAYADRLENDLELVDWPHSIKKLQSDWIGRSTGAEVDFFIGSGRCGKFDKDETFPAAQVWVDARKEKGFPDSPPDDVLRIYTTRPDTLYGATYMVIAPEHPFVEKLTTPENAAAVKAYCEQAARKSELDRTELSKTKTGVFTGSYAINRLQMNAIPIWIADYVLASYGTGAIMAVPGHDARDFEFAKEYRLPIQPVVDPGDSNAEFRKAVLDGEICFEGDGTAINSAHFDFMPTAEFKLRMLELLAHLGVGLGAVNYKLRDWLFSRQRFWGEPFPILHELDATGNPTGLLRAVPADQLPVNLPELADFKPIGEPKPPLEKAPMEWLYVTIEKAEGVSQKAEGGRRKAERENHSPFPIPHSPFVGSPLPPGRYKRETNTMPQWAGSCWYYLRFLDNKNENALVDPAIEKAWMPVDLYIGGAEHAVLHLLYSRFWHKVLFDRGYVSSPEPFTKLVNQGMILGEMEFTGYQGSGCSWVSAADVKFDDNNVPHHKKTGEKLKSCRVEPGDIEKQGDVFVFKMDPSIRVDSRAYKMSKSRGNVVNPDLVVKEYGADALRLYEMFMGPLEATKPWSMTGVSGVRNFLDRVWRLIVNDRAEGIELSPALQKVAPTDDQNRVLHKTIAAVTKDLDHLDFNTAIARMMEFTNFFTKETVRPVEAMEKLVLLLAPFAPHLAEELWLILGHGKTLAYEPWPKIDERWLKEDTVEVPVQVNGKLRGKITVPTGSDQAALEAAAKADEKVAQQLAGKTIVKSVIVPGRLVNFVVK